MWGESDPLAEENQNKAGAGAGRRATRKPRPKLQKKALLLLLRCGRGLLLVRDSDHCTNGLLKHLLQTLLCQRRALQVHLGADLPRQLLPHVRRRQLLSLQVLQRLLVLAEIDLGAHEHRLRLGAVVADLGEPLCLDVVERRGRHHREAEEEHVRLGVAEGTKARVLLLSGSIPKRKVDQASVDLHTGGEVVEHRGDVVNREAVLCVGNQQTGLANGSVADHDALHVLHSHGCCSFVV
mmetsp:Transcript_10903/g.44624  ORF Transcript_10903/g.44624 Transcript_10903/m.44624 type:complete len:238 (+) Transcript_10903:271-984(+)